MKRYEIKKYSSGKIIHQGYYKSFKACLEHAIEKNITLKDADLRYKNLSGINIDTAQLYGVRFDYSNLNNANISEAALIDCNFNTASLIGTCLAESDIRNANFIDATFGATDLTAASLINCKFSTLSSLQLPFQDLESMKDCVFKSSSEHNIAISQPPLVIFGLLHTPITILDKTILLGSRPFILKS